MAVLAVQQISRAGLNTALAAAAAGGDAFPNAARAFLRVKNGHATVARTVTVESQLPAGALPQGAAKTDLVVQVLGAVAVEGDRRTTPARPGGRTPTSST